MSKRRIDPETDEPSLTWRENRMVDEFVSNGGNPARAAVDAGYSPKNPSQAAWNVLNRPASRNKSAPAFNRPGSTPANPSAHSSLKCEPMSPDCFGPDGAFNVELASQNGLGYLTCSANRRPILNE